MTDPAGNDAAAPRGFSGRQVLGFLALAVLFSAAATYAFVRTFVYAPDFTPVELSRPERQELGAKLRALGVDPAQVLPRPEEQDAVDAEGRLLPERYAEDPGRRDVLLSERELNAMVAGNPEFARRFAIDLSDHLASAKLLVPVDPDMPVLGGKTLRLSAGLELDYRHERPVVILRGVSVMGIPLPGAWLGGLKNVDLVAEFGGEPGFWKSFSDGVELIEIRDGELHVKLKP